MKVFVVLIAGFVGLAYTAVLPPQQIVLDSEAIQDAHDGYFRLVQYEHEDCTGTPVSSKTIFFGMCYDSSTSSTKFAMSCDDEGNLLVSDFADSECRGQPKKVDVLPSELNGVCIAGQNLVWRCPQKH